MTLLSCPHCGFSKEIEAARLPQKATRVTCPRCRQTFPLPAGEPPVSDRPAIESPAPQPTVHPDPVTSITPRDLPKAGFWIRATAAILDVVLVFLLQSTLGGLLFLVGAAMVPASDGLAMLVQIFTYLLSCIYYIFFTGYCGQTPGKMALRIKVIRTNGDSLSYLRAAFREIPAKFLAGIIFGIGYLMVAFDDQKQGLHDRMADTYVIKL